jgi:hypothetical protein
MSSPSKLDASELAPVLSGPKRQHFLPRFYLEGFTHNGFLSLYDRDKKEYRKQQPASTGIASLLK